MTLGANQTINVLEVIPSAVTVGIQQYQNESTLQSSVDALTATASGSQTTALLLSSKNNRITTVASAGDAVRLPPAVVGLSINVRNAASANAMNVYPSSAAQGGITGGDQINALGANTAFSQTVAANTITYRCYTAGTWITG
jgi:hypothetical protein